MPLITSTSAYDHFPNSLISDAGAGAVAMPKPPETRPRQRQDVDGCGGKDRVEPGAGVDIGAETGDAALARNARRP